MAMLSAWLFVLRFFCFIETCVAKEKGAIPLSNFDEVIDSYLNDVYKICFYFLRDQELASQITRQTFLNFYDRYENVKSDWIYWELVSTAKKLSEECKAVKIGRAYEAET